MHHRDRMPDVSVVGYCLAGYWVAACTQSNAYFEIAAETPRSVMMVPDGALSRVAMALRGGGERPGHQ